jgi:hypothetical protein
VPPSSEAITLDRVDRPTPPPGFVSPLTGAAHHHGLPRHDRGPTHAAPEYARTSALALTPQGLAWVPAAALTLIFLLAFFDWAGSYPGGTKLYSQNAWESMVRGYTAGNLPEKALADESSIQAKMRTSWWMWLYMPLLVATLLAAWAERILLRKNPDPYQIPEWARPVWPHRFAILAGAAGALLLLLLFQSAVGFGLNTAVKRHVDEKFATAEEAARDNSAKTAEVAVEKGKMLSGYALQATTARQLVLAAHVVVAAAFLGRFWLERRGNRPPPRLLVQY